MLQENCRQDESLPLAKIFNPQQNTSREFQKRMKKRQHHDKVGFMQTQKVAPHSETDPCDVPYQKTEKKPSTNSVRENHLTRFRTYSQFKKISTILIRNRGTPSSQWEPWNAQPTSLLVRDWSFLLRSGKAAKSSFLTSSVTESGRQHLHGWSRVTSWPGDKSCTPC